MHDVFLSSLSIMCPDNVVIVEVNKCFSTSDLEFRVYDIRLFVFCWLSFVHD